RGAVGERERSLVTRGCEGRRGAVQCVVDVTRRAEDVGDDNQARVYSIRLSPARIHAVDQDDRAIGQAEDGAGGGTAVLVGDSHRIDAGLCEVEAAHLKIRGGRARTERAIEEPLAGERVPGPD